MVLELHFFSKYSSNAHFDTHLALARSRTHIYLIKKDLLIIESYIKDHSRLHSLDTNCML